MMVGNPSMVDIDPWLTSHPHLGREDLVAGWHWAARTEDGDSRLGTTTPDCTMVHIELGHGAHQHVLGRKFVPGAHCTCGCTVHIMANFAQLGDVVRIFPHNNRMVQDRY